MYLLPGNPFSQAVEAYTDSGEALCSKGMHAVPCPFKLASRIQYRSRLPDTQSDSKVRGTVLRGIGPLRGSVLGVKGPRP